MIDVSSAETLQRTLMLKEMHELRRTASMERSFVRESCEKDVKLLALDPAMLQAAPFGEREGSPLSHEEEKMDHVSHHRKRSRRASETTCRAN